MEQGINYESPSLRRLTIEFEPQAAPEGDLEKQPLLLQHKSISTGDKSSESSNDADPTASTSRINDDQPESLLDKT